MSEHAKEFADHQITREPRARCWKVQKSGTWIYGFFITFSPGVLTLSGDVGELVITHYHAMPTLEAALQWLDGIEFSYLMGKSSAKQEYSPTASAKCAVAMANEDLKYDDDRRWKKLFQIFEFDLDPDARDPGNAEHRAALAKMLTEDGIQIDQLGEIDPDAWTQEYPSQCRWQFEAIKRWHALVTNPAAPERLWAYLAARAA